MKIKQKRTYLLEDCFDATEGATRVHIGRYRSTVMLEITHKGVQTERELSLSQLADLLVKDDHDPTPWCAHCNANTAKDCHCPPDADNE